MTFAMSAKIMVRHKEFGITHHRNAGIPYDCDSIMNFGTETFSLGKPTMESVDPNCDLRCKNLFFFFAQRIIRENETETIEKFDTISTSQMGRSCL